jgi:hypothetical protein
LRRLTHCCEICSLAATRRWSALSTLREEGQVELSLAKRLHDLVRADLAGPSGRMSIRFLRTCRPAASRTGRIRASRKQTAGSLARTFCGLTNPVVGRTSRTQASWPRRVRVDRG